MSRSPRPSPSSCGLVVGLRARSPPPPRRSTRALRAASGRLRRSRSSSRRSSGSPSGCARSPSSLPWLLAAQPLAPRAAAPAGRGARRRLPARASASSPPGRASASPCAGAAACPSRRRRCSSRSRSASARCASRAHAGRRPAAPRRRGPGRGAPARALPAGLRAPQHPAPRAADPPARRAAGPSTSWSGPRPRSTTISTRVPELARAAARDGGDDRRADRHRCAALGRRAQHQRGGARSTPRACAAPTTSSACVPFAESDPARSRLPGAAARARHRRRALRRRARGARLPRPDSLRDADLLRDHRCRSWCAASARRSRPRS